MSSVPYDVPGRSRPSPNCVGAIADATPECWITPIDNEHLPITYATTNFFSFLQGERGLDLGEHVPDRRARATSRTVGRVIAEAVEQSDRRVVLIASGALSHTFHTLRTLRQHEAAGEEHIFSERGAPSRPRGHRRLARGDHAQRRRQHARVR